MYFKNRVEAGQKLAIKLKKYSGQPCAVVALNSGAVLVGAQIATLLHASLMALTSDTITLPGEHDPLATMTADTFTYNGKFSSGELEELTSEYRGLIDEQRITKFHKLNRLLSDGGEINPKFLQRHVVIIVSDAFQNGALLEVAADFLKRIKVKKLIIATPLASIEAVDRMHLLGDEIYCLSVGENLMESNHYYDENILPDHHGVLKIIHNISLTWDLSRPPTSTR